MRLAWLVVHFASLSMRPFEKKCLIASFDCFSTPDDLISF